MGRARKFENLTPWNKITTVGATTDWSAYYVTDFNIDQLDATVWKAFGKNPGDPVIFNDRGEFNNSLKTLYDQRGSYLVTKLKRKLLHLMSNRQSTQRNIYTYSILCFRHQVILENNCDVFAGD